MIRSSIAIPPTKIAYLILAKIELCCWAHKIMVSPASSPVTLASPWKRIIVRSLLGGAACGLVLATTLVLFFYYSHRPKGWSKDAIRVFNVKAEPITKLNKQLKDESSGIIFSVDLQNTTSDDIT